MQTPLPSSLAQQGHRPSEGLANPGMGLHMVTCGLLRPQDTHKSVRSMNQSMGSKPDACLQACRAAKRCMHFLIACCIRHQRSGHAARHHTSVQASEAPTTC